MTCNLFLSFIDYTDISRTGFEDKDATFHERLHEGVVTCVSSGRVGTKDILATGQYDIFVHTLSSHTLSIFSLLILFFSSLLFSFLFYNICGKFQINRKVSSHFTVHNIQSYNKYNHYLQDRMMVLSVCGAHCISKTAID